MSLARPYYYWTEDRTFTSSNSQFPAVAPYVVTHTALRRDDDQYVRSIWSARVSYLSPGTHTTYGWFGSASVRLVVSWDPNDLVSPSDVGDDDPLTLGFQELQPRRWPLVTSPQYLIDWTSPVGDLTLETARNGLGVGVRPNVLGSIFYIDLDSMFSGAAESGSIRRLQMESRVLWASSQAP